MEEDKQMTRNRKIYIKLVLYDFMKNHITVFVSQDTPIKFLVEKCNEYKKSDLAKDYNEDINCVHLLFDYEHMDENKCISDYPLSTGTKIFFYFTEN